MIGLSQLNLLSRKTAVGAGDKSAVRWLVIMIEITILASVALWTEIDPPLVPLTLIILFGVIYNVYLSYTYPPSESLSEGQLGVQIVLDTGQIALFLFFFGGLTNPAFLFLFVPVAVALSARENRVLLASTLSVATATAILGLFAPPLMANGAPATLQAIIVPATAVTIVFGLGIAILLAHRITIRQDRMQTALRATELALNREKMLSDIGGIVSATAHQLGAPLSTILLASSELDSLLDQNPEAQREARLIRDEARRCSAILATIGDLGQGEMSMTRMPIASLLREAAEPHENRGKLIKFSAEAVPPAPNNQPVVIRSAELVHAYRNLIENAVDHAEEKAEVRIAWSDKDLRISVHDDGVGFPAAMLGRKAASSTPTRDAVISGGNMGLGLFISRALIERAGGTLDLTNDQSGACAVVTWPLSAVAV